ncbi:glycosyltransferase family 2 protein [Magnetofaba australis]|uniref:Putative glycosyl transferase family protein n=1 Tax=Magnetofaba australis IT-1 TaxID=1434232 RepID=A0A1Y2K6N6_9PROT|nr:glycosyltransferase family 2 protein [Magnetofaba australis]OSM05200.1 putative glycosyl transferase family protein [Magnetofaba australis IT-1]
MSQQHSDAAQPQLLSAVFSMRNEEGVLDELIARMRAALDPVENLDYELIFVNDDSTDRSLEILTAYAAEDKRIKVINTSRRFGVIQGNLAGFRHAKGDAIVYLDADLQDPPELIPTLIEKWREGAEVVHTTRTHRHGENPVKMAITRGAYRVINFFSEIEIPMDTGNFKLISRRAMDELLKIKEQEPFLRGLVCWVGFKQEFVYYERQARYAGVTHFALLRSFNPTRSFVSGVIAFSTIPLYFALLLGMLVSSGSFAYLLYIIVTRLTGMHQPGWSAIMVTMLFLGGVILFTIGVLGVYIAQIYANVQGRPQYIIDNKINLDEDES